MKGQSKMVGPSGGNQRQVPVVKLVGANAKRFSALDNDPTEPEEVEEGQIKEDVRDTHTTQEGTKAGGRRGKTTEEKPI